MDKIEKEIIEGAKEFANSNNTHYDDITESMILNAMREQKSQLEQLEKEKKTFEGIPYISVLLHTIIIPTIIVIMLVVIAHIILDSYKFDMIIGWYSCMFYRYLSEIFGIKLINKYERYKQ